MQSFQAPAGAGQHLLRVIRQHYPQLSSGQLYKALRQKDIRVNGRRVHDDLILQGGEKIQIYLPDACFALQDQGRNEAGLAAGPADDSAGRTIEWTIGRESARMAENRLQPTPFRIIFADSRLLILDKAPGLAVHGGGDAIAGEPTLIELVRRQWQDDQIELCHRLDRNTGGLIMLARQPAIRTAVMKLMENGQLLKRYRCLVRGVPSAGHPVTAADGQHFWQVEAWLEKVSHRSEVYIHADEHPGDLPVITRYQVLRVFSGYGPDNEPVSELKVELVTGRTHQIRAHLAFLGHPLLGDGKYGRNQYNRHFRGPGGPLRSQQLFACELVFLKKIQGPLADLAGRTLKVEPAYAIDLPV